MISIAKRVSPLAIFELAPIDASDANGITAAILHAVAMPFEPEPQIQH